VEAKKEADPSVAVLPFVNMSSDPEQEFFSDGISEEILNVLTRIPNLKVAARTSSFQFKGQNLDIAKIGQQLQVNHVLEGSVRKAGTTIRITAQLVETETGFHLWSNTFDRQLEDVFAIQDEIAGAIARELRMRLVNLPERATTPVNMDAYELYLKGRGLVAKRKAVDLFTAMDILKSAIEIEPQYAQAMATLAKAYAVLPWFSYEIPAGEARETARQWTEKALVIEPDNVEALAVLAIVYSQNDMNFAAARELLERAVKLNPGSVAANNFLGDVCIRAGDLDCALIYESRAAELDPLGPVQLTDLANVYLIRGQYDKTIQLAERALSLDASFTQAYRHLFNANFMKGNDKQMANHLQESSRLSVFPEDAMHSFQFQYDFISGNRERALKGLSRRVDLAATGEISAVDVAYDAAAIGDFDTAGNMLLKAYENKDGTWLFPLFIRLPEQAPDSASWQKFWSQPRVAELAELRRKNGLKPFPDEFNNGMNS